MSSSILRTANGIIFPLTLLFALYMALKGHNFPGGGFIGGLIAAVALVLYRMSHGADAMMRLMPIHPRIVVALGLGIAALTGIVPLIFAEPMLRSIAPYINLGVGDPVHVPSALFFDLGVLLVVVGVSVGMIVRLGEELPQEEEEPQP
ncbi:MAG: MnhB domain-containing protein [Planctomycetota bacterium]